MSKEKREILEHLVEYLQQKIDSGEHKIFFNDLMWDEKTIDCINAINNTLEEIERLNNIINKGIEAINVYQDGKTLSVGYQDLKRIRGILQGNEFDLQMFEEYLQELKGGNKE